jgi:hypothetical protein
MSIRKKTQISELYDYRHIHDNNPNKPADYKNKLFSNLLSTAVFRNNILSMFLSKIQELSVWTIDSALVVRNFWNYTVDKYYDEHID